MASGGQILSNNGLLGTGDSSSTLAVAGMQKTPVSDFKSLNNKEFSELMGQQEASPTTASNVVVPQKLSINTDVDIELTEEQVDALLHTLQGGTSGNVLPFVAGELEQGVLDDQQIGFQGLGFVDSDILAEVHTQAGEAGDELSIGFVYGPSNTELTAGSAPIVAPVAKTVGDQVLAPASTVIVPQPAAVDSSAIASSASTSSSPAVLFPAEGLQMSVVDNDIAAKASAAAVAQGASTQNIAGQTQVPFMDMATQIQMSSKAAYGTKNGAIDLASLAKLSDSSALSASASTVSSGVSPNAAMVVEPQAMTYRDVSSTAFQASVPVEVGKPGWSDNVMQKVMWMSSQQINKAEIALDPPELGPLQVRISTQSDQTTISFTSHHGSVRDALDQGLPRLREMMAEQGIDLADVDVSDQRAFDRQAEEDHESQASAQASGELGQDGIIDEPLVEQQQGGEQRQLGLVDQYA
jgi:flagellar hook-length control protein FliK